MAAWIVCALCALVIIKPQEFVDELSGTPILYVLFGIAAVLIALDVTWRRLRPSLSPQVPWVLAFLAWSALTTAIKRPDALVDRGTAVTIVGVIFLTVAVGAGSARGVRALGATIVICATLVCGVTLAQGAAPLTCMVPRDPDDWDSTGELSPDGRPCETSADCLKGAIDFRFRHRCERPGPLGTSSIGGRVRYRGSLGDPNEVSLMICACLPLAFAFTGGGGAALPRRGREGRGKRPPAGAPRGAGGAFVRSLVTAAAIGAAGVVVVLSQSRTGLIVFLLVLGLTFIRRMGAWGVVLGCLIGPPMLLLGGRSGADADQSTEERLELVLDGLEMIKSTRGIGVGVGQFGAESGSGLTAHNAYLLAAAEAGLVGMCLFAVALYVSLKVPLALWLGDHAVSATVRRFAPAIFVSLAGCAVGIFFLSWAYKDVLYIALGLSAALHAAARAEDRSVSVRVSAREIALVCAAVTAVLVGLILFVRIRA